MACARCEMMHLGQIRSKDNSITKEPLLEKEVTSHSLPSIRKWYALLGIAIVLLLGNWVFCKTSTSSSGKSCREPAIRREWRALSSSERLEYIRAVKCLSSIPSTIYNGTLHDEFAYLHHETGGYSHQAAPFLPWHRYFIHVYEQTLKQRCQYEGHLPYWDWTRDWEDLTQAPVWDAIEGFGGNGNTSLPVTVGHGHCIEDGPFADLQVQYYSEDWNPHCLSRGFLAAELRDRFVADRLNKSVMEDIMNEPRYFDFLLRLEDGPHSAIPITVRGDFSRFTAPNDPIFFLHHAQLDRLWWHWQSQDIKERSIAYDGPSSHDSFIAAQVTNVIEMDPIAPNIPVSSVLTIDNEFLCYEYGD